MSHQTWTPIKGVGRAALCSGWREGRICTEDAAGLLAEACRAPGLAVGGLCVCPQAAEGPMRACPLPLCPVDWVWVWVGS